MTYGLAYDLTYDLTYDVQRDSSTHLCRGHVTRYLAGRATVYKGDSCRKLPIGKLCFTMRSVWHDPLSPDDYALHWWAPEVEKNRVLSRHRRPRPLHSD